MSLWKRTGNIAFWICWPLLYVYLLRGKRTRLLLVADGKVLVVKGWLGSGKWILPGGGLHWHEDPLGGVLRELREEAGIALDGSTVLDLGVRCAADNGFKCTYHGFGAALPKPVAYKKQLLEIVEVAWIPLDSLSADNTVQSTLDMVSAWKTQG